MSMRCVIGVFLVAILAGCGSPPKERFYALSVVDAANSSPAQAAFAVAVGPVTVPEMVDRPQMVLRVAANRMELSELNRWAEPLKRALPRAIAASIARETPTARVYLSGTDAVNPADYRVRIEVERFDSELGKGAVVEAAWSIGGGSSTAVVYGRSLVRESAGGAGYDELVAAQSAAAAAIGREIAAALTAIKR